MAVSFRFWLAALLIAGAACAPARTAVRPRPAPRAPTDADLKEAARQYYMAVSAYLAADYEAARAHLKRVDLLDPTYPSARALEKKIRAAEEAGRSTQ